MGPRGIFGWWVVAFVGWGLEVGGVWSGDAEPGGPGADVGEAWLEEASGAGGWCEFAVGVYACVGDAVLGHLLGEESSDGEFLVGVWLLCFEVAEDADAEVGGVLSADMGALVVE